jgi:ribosome-binding protein aMBF1 (putative translation factor)
MNKTKSVRKNINLEDYIKDKFKTKEDRKRLEREYKLACIALDIAELRIKQGLSQADLARQLHTKQQYISRIEHPDNENITVGTLNKLAEVFHKKLSVKFV